MKLRLRLLRVEVFCALVGVLLVVAGCEPEMPVPPPRESTNPAEDSFVWAMERMEHALEQFRPSSSMGLSVKREIDYELIPPAGDKTNYTARVSISTNTVFRPDSPSSIREKQAAADKKKEANKLKLDDPFKVAGQDPLGNEVLELPDVPAAEVVAPDIADPRVPTKQLDEKRDYLLEYVNDHWKLQSADLEEHERMWFDYALLEGDFAPEAKTGP